MGDTLIQRANDIQWNLDHSYIFLRILKRILKNGVFKMTIFIQVLFCILHFTLAFGADTVTKQWIAETNYLFNDEGELSNVISLRL